MRGFFFESWRVAAISRAIGHHLLIDIAQRDNLDRHHLDQAEQGRTYRHHPHPMSPTRFGG
jgi:hypothetical protein